jgi:hypothetical protein
MKWTLWRCISLKALFHWAHDGEFFVSFLNPTFRENRRKYSDRFAAIIYEIASSLNRDVMSCDSSVWGTFASKLSGDTMKSIIALCAAFAMVCSVNSSHAGIDYPLELDGIKGESGESSFSRAQPIPGATNLAPMPGQPAKGGARALTHRAEGTHGCDVCGGVDALAPAHKPKSGLLLPAVQKVREAAAR